MNILKILATASKKLNFDAQTGSFTVGNTVTGATSGATGRVKNVNSTTLFLVNVSGTFVDDEIIYESALGNELLTNGDMELDANWGNYSTPVTNERSVEQKHGGTYSRKLVGDSGGDGIHNTTATLVVNNFYKSTGWVYISARTAEGIGLYSVRTDSWALYSNFVTLSTTNSWVQLINIIQAVVTGHSQLFSQVGAGDITGYTDDASVKQITNAALANGVLY